jgi:hypothetical protein
MKLKINLFIRARIDDKVLSMDAIHSLDLRYSPVFLSPGCILICLKGSSRIDILNVYSYYRISSISNPGSLGNMHFWWVLFRYSLPTESSLNGKTK